MNIHPPRTGSAPVVVSFYGGDSYYYNAAVRLEADCKALGIDHDIVELRLGADFNWALTCRKKVAFYLAMLEKHRRPILWVDVDCRLVKMPEALLGCHFDMAGFLRGFNYIRDYSSVEAPRFWSPSFLYFSGSTEAVRFVELMNRIAEDHPDGVTDDFLLQEAWARYEGMLNIGLLKPNLIEQSPDKITGETAFIFQASGNVQDWHGRVRQHEKPRLAPSFQAGVLLDIAIRVKTEADGGADRALGLLQEAVRLAPDDSRIAVHYAETLKGLKRMDAARQFLDDFITRNPSSLEARQKAITIAMTARDHGLVHQYIQDMLASENETFHDYAQSAAFDLALETRSESLKLKPQDRVPLWWMKSPYPGNFGDVLNPYIIEKISGMPPRFTSRGKGMLAIGSVIKFARTGTHVWGTGTPRTSDRLAPDARYHAVRGPLTRNLVLQSGGTCPAIYGDPALLLPQYYRPRTTRKYALGFISHTAHRHRITIAPDMREISILRCGYDDIEAFIDELNECEAVLSTSLHGLIVSHAYGIPARWCTLSNAERISGDGTKFLDYFLSVSMPVQEPLDLAAFPQVSADLRKHVPALDMAFDPEPLLHAFPYLRSERSSI